MTNIICPFCGEEDFDLRGLKHHLENYCTVYDATGSVYDEPEEQEAASDDGEDTP